MIIFGYYFMRWLFYFTAENLLFVPANFGNHHSAPQLITVPVFCILLFMMQVQRAFFLDVFMHCSAVTC